MGLFSFFSKKGNQNKSNDNKTEITNNSSNEELRPDPLSFDDQINVLKLLGYEFEADVTKEMILYFAFEISWEDDTEKYIQDNPFSVLYQILGLFNGFHTYLKN